MRARVQAVSLSSLVSRSLASALGVWTCARVCLLGVVPFCELLEAGKG